MSETLESIRVSPRFKERDAFTVVGLARYVTFDQIPEIGGLWAEFGPSIGSVPGQVGAVTYGISYRQGDMTGFGYMAAVEVSDDREAPAGLERRTIPASRYAVFTHSGSVDSLSETIQGAMGGWLPNSGYRIPGETDGDVITIERYGEAFDADTAGGDLEVWIPIEQNTP